MKLDIPDEEIILLLNGIRGLFIVIGHFNISPVDFLTL